MKSQVPAEGILKRNNWGDAIAYQVVCECQDANHDHNVWVEADDHRVTVTTYTTQKSKWWNLNRWQTIWILLIKGHVEYEANIIMTKQQTLNYAETLKKKLAQYNIKVHFGANVTAIDGKTKTIHFESKEASKNIESKFIITWITAFY